MSRIMGLGKSGSLKGSLKGSMRALSGGSWDLVSIIDYKCIVVEVI